METCRFEHGDCVIHSPTAGPTTHRGPPALCSHAAADLERRLEAQATSIKTYQQVCARLEEEKAQADQMLQEAGALVCEGNSLLEKALADGCTYLMKYAHAEAREAAMRRTAYVLAMEILQSDLYQHADEEVRTAIESATARLSPDAGRAPIDEVEALREVARLSKIVEQYGCEVGSQTWSELRDALDKLGEEGK